MPFGLIHSPDEIPKLKGLQGGMDNRSLCRVRLSFLLSRECPRDKDMKGGTSTIDRYILRYWMDLGGFHYFLYIVHFPLRRFGCDELPQTSESCAIGIASLLNSVRKG